MGARARCWIGRVLCSMSQISTYISLFVPLFVPSFVPYLFPHLSLIGSLICSHTCIWLGFQAKQKERILSLVEEERYPDIFLVWMTIVQRIMHLHRRLFKRGVWWSHAVRCHSMEAPMSQTYEAFLIIVYTSD